jgi:hypothetical protein
MGKTKGNCKLTWPAATMRVRRYCPKTAPKNGWPGTTRFLANLEFDILFCRPFFPEEKTTRACWWVHIQYIVYDIVYDVVSDVVYDMHTIVNLLSRRRLKPCFFAGCWQKRTRKAGYWPSFIEASKVSPWARMGLASCCFWSCHPRRCLGPSAGMDVVRVSYNSSGVALASNEAGRVDWCQSFGRTADSRQEWGQMDCRWAQLYSAQQRGSGSVRSSAHVWWYPMGMWLV